MVRWVCKSCSILVDTKAKEIRGQCYQGFACGEKGEATDEVYIDAMLCRPPAQHRFWLIRTALPQILKIGNLCCNCAKHAGMEQVNAKGERDSDNRRGRATTERKARQTSASSK